VGVDLPYRFDVAVFGLREVDYCWFVWMFMMCCRYKIVMCIPRVLKVIALMGGCRYSSVFGGSWRVFGYCDV
jgi:hypothetical protein